MDVINHQTFDWIFFAIVGLPLVFAVIELAKPDWLERWIREKPDTIRRGRP